MKTFLFIIIILTFSINNLFASNMKPEHPNNIAVNLLAIPVKTGVITYERYFSPQSLWVGLEHYFNDLEKENHRNTKSVALEYRRYVSGSMEKAEGFFGGVYVKNRWGKETQPENPKEFHRYTVLFTGLTGGYQYHLNRWVLSAFAGYGLPIALSQESSPTGNPNDFNEGYKTDLRLGLTIGFAF